MLPAGAVGSAGPARPCTRAAGAEAELLFPRGAPDMVEAYVDLADRRMADGADLGSGLRLTARVRTLLTTRFAQAEPRARGGAARGGGCWRCRQNALLAARCTARTVDAIWFAAGDTSADFSWYTKRALLAGVYSVHAALLAQHQGATPERGRRRSWIGAWQALRASASCGRGSSKFTRGVIDAQPSEEEPRSCRQPSWRLEHAWRSALAPGRAHSHHHPALSFPRHLSGRRRGGLARSGRLSKLARRAGGGVRQGHAHPV